jgi:hypothetical protein
MKRSSAAAIVANRSRDYTRKRKETRKAPNPFKRLSRASRRALVQMGIIAAAAKMGGGRHCKATYSRTFAGKPKRANIEVILHLQTAAQRIARLMNSINPR